MSGSNFFGPHHTNGAVPGCFARQHMQCLDGRHKGRFPMAVHGDHVPHHRFHREPGRFHNKRVVQWHRQRSGVDGAPRPRSSEGGWITTKTMDVHPTRKMWTPSKLSTLFRFREGPLHSDADTGMALQQNLTRNLGTIVKQIDKLFVTASSRKGRGFNGQHLGFPTLGPKFFKRTESGTGQGQQLLFVRNDRRRSQLGRHSVRPFRRGLHCQCMGRAGERVDTGAHHRADWCEDRPFLCFGVKEDGGTKCPCSDRGT